MNLDDKIKEYNSHVDNVTQIITNSNIEKIISYIKQIPLLCSLNDISKENRRLRALDEEKKHPKGVSRGEIYITLK